VVEVLLRLVALSPRVFFLRWYNVLDLVVITTTFIISCVAISGTTWAEGLTLFTALRFVRIIRIVRIYSEKHNLETAARQLISQNKRRYQQDGFDLDLTYVTNRVIATSFPSSGLWAAYRNPIDKVARFLNTKHGDRYRIYNLCSEKTYNTALFHDRVERVMIDDHNVPSIEQMLKFADSVRAWLGEHPDNVIVVHCKGGKGRTGTMICVWLIESGVFSAADSLDYFGHRRTDTNVSKKFQGVETPSQSRYVAYYERVKNNGRQLLPATPLRIREIVISGMMYVGNGTGSDFSVDIDQGRGNTVYSAHFGTGRNCRAEYNPTADILRVSLDNCPLLEGDTRLLFQTTARNVPKHYEKCPFYFWFHTGFVEGDELLLRRDDLDNPHKSKTWHCFRESFSVKLIFER
jgi:PTEN phosphatase family protein